MTAALTKIDLITIGIDPDVSKSGVATLFNDKRLDLRTLTFFELYDYLKGFQNVIKEVVVEGGWLNAKSNFHRKGKGEGIASRIGKNVGSNHESGRKIVEMCVYLQIPYRVIKPLKKMWKGKDGKITHDEFKMITGHSKQSNQETRDAALLIWK